MCLVRKTYDKMFNRTLDASKSQINFENAFITQEKELDEVIFSWEYSRIRIRDGFHIMYCKQIKYANYVWGERGIEHIFVFG